VQRNRPKEAGSIPPPQGTKFFRQSFHITFRSNANIATALVYLLAHELILWVPLCIEQRPQFSLSLHTEMPKLQGTTSNQPEMETHSKKDY